jgi:hypothetical protein
MGRSRKPFAMIEYELRTNPKVMVTGPAGVGLYVLGILWSAEHLTDGWIPEDEALRLVAVESGPSMTELIERLVQAGLWEHDDGGYRVHDYTEHQTPKSTVLAKRVKSRDRQRRKRIRDRKEAKSVTL